MIEIWKHIEAEGIRHISIIGLGKNVGKTTTLQWLIDTRPAQLASQDLCLMSIGMDGERLDSMLGIDKPSIHAPAGTWLATADDALKLGSAGFEIWDSTGIHSPLGEILIARVVSAGTVVLAGVRQIANVERIQSHLQQRLAASGQVPFFLIDGAFGRTAAASPDVCDAMILSTGAALVPDFQELIRATVTAWQKWTLPLTSDDDTPLLQEAVIRGKPYAQGKTMAVPGALTDRILELWGDGVQAWLLRDPAKLLLSEERFRRLLQRGTEIRVQRRVPVLAITVNPTSVTGYQVPAEVFRLQLQHVVSVPVVDCFREGGWQ